ncbi:hypothetical protein EXIGLDRAFT_693089 [Exidia glandulosa HHB12029]|uniref:Uncharacterized protein n=1 Tax=Exidia glandulosa HHB12029 TaxID=1314781 RepID=A0A165HJ83_EXIGL|nr:hypothetical protein EXIGLDRAFT_693089 [Exidia glandulosa HHB12029]
MVSGLTFLKLEVIHSVLDAFDGPLIHIAFRRLDFLLVKMVDATGRTTSLTSLLRVGEDTLSSRAAVMFPALKRLVFKKPDHAYWLFGHFMDMGKADLEPLIKSFPKLEYALFEPYRHKYWRWKPRAWEVWKTFGRDEGLGEWWLPKSWYDGNAEKD